MNWSSSSAALDPLPQWAVALPARLSCWGRLNFRLQSAADPAVEATPLTPPVCGILLPDFVDQSLEVYDADRQRRRAAHRRRPDSRTTPARRGRCRSRSRCCRGWPPRCRPASDPTRRDHEPDAAPLRAVAAGAVARRAGQCAGLARDRLHRDAARVRHGALDARSRRSSTATARVRLLGEPILVMNARLSFEASNQSATELKSQPPGDRRAARVAGAARARRRRHPPGRRRAGLLPDRRIAVRGPVRAGQPRGGREGGAQSDGVRRRLQKIEKITHPFIVDQVAEFELAGQHRRSTP